MYLLEVEVEDKEEGEGYAGGGHLWDEVEVKGSDTECLGWYLDEVS